MNRNLAENRRHQKSYRHMERSEYLTRAVEVAPRGETLARKLNRTKVLQIRKNALGLTDKQQAEKYGVHPNTIYKIRKRLIWELV